MSEAALTQLVEHAKISKALKEKLINFGRNKDKESDELKGKILKLNADHEQKCHDLDKKLTESSNLLEEETTKFKKSQLACKELEKKVEEMEDQMKENVKDVSLQKKELNDLVKSKTSLEEEKVFLQQTVDRKELEIKYLNDEWKVLSNRLKEVTESKNHLEMKVDEIGGSEATFQFRCKRLEEEKKLRCDENEQLSLDLKRITNQYSMLQKEKASLQSSLNSKLEIQIDENKHLVKSVHDHKKNKIDLEEKIESLQTKITKSSDEFSSLENILRNELSAQTRLATLYSEAASENDKKANEFLSAIEELQTIINPTIEENKKLKEDLEKTKMMLEDEEKMMLKLRKELERANDLLESHRKKSPSEEQLAQLHPDAALTNKFIKSGMTLTELYSQLIDQEEQLDIEKSENKRLNDAMEQILEELNAKAPVILRQKEDYERALETIGRLTSQQDATALEFQTLNREKDESLRKTLYLERENLRLSQESADQSKQIHHLIKEIEESRGRRVVMSPRTRRGSVNQTSLLVNDDGSCNDVSSSNDVISSSLVTFKDIAELQNQNKKLLAVVRTLSKDQEDQERATTDTRLKNLQMELESVNEEVERLRNERERQIELVEGVVKQRDMYKVLLAQEQNVSTSVLLNSTSVNVDSVAGGDTSMVAKENVTSLKKKLDEVQKMLKDQNEDAKEMREEMEKNQKVLQEQLEDAKIQIQEERATNIKNNSQLMFVNERCDNLKRSADISKKEADSFRDRYNEMNKLNAIHEKESSDLREDLRSFQEILTPLQARLERTKNELEIQNRSSDRLTAENESLRRELNNKTLLFTNLHQMQQDMDKQIFETRSQLQSKIQLQDQELQTLRNEARDDARHQLERIQAAEKEALALKSIHKSDLKQLEESRMEVNAAREALVAEQQAKDELMTELKKLQARSDDVIDVGEDEDEKIKIQRLQRDLRLKVEEINGLKNNLKKMKISIQQYKDIATAAEDTLKKGNQENEILLDKMQERLNNSENHFKEVEKQMKSVREENELMKKEQLDTADAVDKKTRELREKLNSLQPEVEKANQKMNEALKEAEQARDDLLAQENLAEKINSKYQREILRHAELMKEHVQIKESNKKSDNLIKDSEARCRSLQSTLEETKSGFEEIKKKMQLEVEKEKQRATDLEKQNLLLHESMNSQMLQMCKKPTRTSPRKLLASRDPVVMATTTTEVTANEDSSKLMEVIRYLRREKEISVTNCELVTSELSRVKMELNRSKELYKDTQDVLMTSRDQIESQQKQLNRAKSIEREMNALRSVQRDNEVLRDERESMTSELRAANEQIKKLQNEGEPQRKMMTQLRAANTAMVAEKKSLKDEVERWRARVAQMTSSPRRCDVDELRKKEQERKVAIEKLESTEQQLVDAKAQCVAMTSQISEMKAKLEAGSKLDAIAEKKIKNHDRLKQLAIQFRAKNEENLQQIEKFKKELEAMTSQLATKDEELKKLRVCVTKLEADKSTTATSSQSTVCENDNKTNEVKLQNDVLALRTSLLEKSRNNEEKTKQLETLTGKNRALQKALKTLQSRFEAFKAKRQKESTRDAEELKETVEKLELEKKNDVNTRNDLQNKIEELQRQLLESRSVSVNCKSPNSGSSQTQRKAANVRPIGQQRINQVPPYLRTARVIPEQREDIENVPVATPTGLPTTNQIPSSSTQSTATVQPSVFVRVPPMSGRPQQPQQHVVSSGTPQAPIQPATVPQPPTVTNVARSGSVTMATAGNVARVAVEGSTNENEQAVVSSSDDQAHEENRAGPSNAAAMATSDQSGVPQPGTSEPEQSVEMQSSSSSQQPTSVAASSSEITQAKPSMKRNRDEVSDDVTTASSSNETKGVAFPAAKRKRVDCGQCSSNVDDDVTAGGDDVTTGESSSEQRDDDVTVTTQPADDDVTPPPAEPSSSGNEVATSDVIVLSSDEDETNGGDDQQMEVHEEDQNEELEDGEVEDNDQQRASDETAATSSIFIQQQQAAAAGGDLLPIPPIPNLARVRNFRPGPLTPNIAQTTNQDDADGVVPYTPTLLPQRGNDEGYYAVNSPRVTPQQTRFRFEDVVMTTNQQSADAVPAGFSSTDFNVASHEAVTMATASGITSSSPADSQPETSIQITPSSSSIPASTSEVTAVSSSIEEVETSEEVQEPESAPPSGSTASGNDAETREASSIPRSSIIKRGSKLRVIGK